VDTQPRTITGPQLAIAALIIYGSLYPFNFVWPAATAATLRQLIESSSLWSSRGDVAGNLLLFLPWGAFAPRDTTRQRRHWPTLIYGLALALLLQLLQLGLPSRDAALSDVFWNGLGIVIGQLALSPLIARVQAADGKHAPLDAGIILPLLWLTLMALPLVPSLDWQSLKAHLRAFAGESGPSLPELFLAYAGVLVVGCALLSRFQALRALGLLALVLGLAAAAKLLTLHNALYRTELVAWAFAWVGVLAFTQTRPALLAPVAFASMLAGLTLAALHPFEFTASPSEFKVMPFSGYLQGDMLGNLRELAQSAWITVTLIWLGARLGGHAPGIGVFLVGWVLLLEISQMWVVGRSADITPALTTLMISLLMRSLLRRSSGHTAPVLAPQIQVQEPRPSGLTVPLVSAALWIAVVMGIAWLIRLPGVPYNLRELFLANGHPLAIAAFTVALLWLGAGTWFAVWLASRTRHLWLTLPAALALTGAISLLLLTASVTEESIMDIAGSSNLHWMVVNKLIWGDWWADVFSTTLGPAFVAPLERVVRYLALYLPPSAILAVGLIALKPGSPVKRSTDTVKAALALLPVLWLCKTIAFDWSSTDNLNELVAPTGNFGLGGGPYLYALLAVAAINVALLAQRSTPRAFLMALLLTAVCLPVSWILLSNGLSSAIEKYGTIYSGTQFLLGPDRKIALPETALQIRWALLYLSLVAVGAIGIRIGRTLTKRHP
jgi:VanZ family protein